jgi:two-component system sensor histidine kinase/response regulator
MDDISSQGDILIVDDTPANLRLLSQMLVERGYKVRADGAHALTAAQSVPPDLVLLDIRMPEMDGYEVCQRLKADPRTQEIPILFISALGETEDKVKAFSLGGVDYITKPFQAAEVLSRVETHLALRNLNRQLQAANAELARRLEELQDRNEELDAFAHTVAHDIKGPVATIASYAEVLAQGGTTMPEMLQGEFLQTLERGARRVGNIVDELLLLTSVRKMDLQLELLDMDKVVEEACQRTAHMIAQYQAEIIFPLAWPKAVGYGPWVVEVWANYLGNGCKYGGKPPRLELGADVLDDAQVRFWVRDNGEGISPADQVRLFMPFTRISQARAKGHGLGLSIVRRIVERLNGRVGVESDGVPGHGSLFYFTLPGT